MPRPPLPPKGRPCEGPDAPLGNPAPLTRRRTAIPTRPRPLPPGQVAAERLYHHPDGALARVFNQRANAVRAADIGRVYLGTPQTIGQLFPDGEGDDPATFRRYTFGVLKTKSFHYSYLAQGRDHPTRPPDGTVGPDGELVRPPLFVPGVEEARLAAPARATNPTLGASYRELLELVLREARDVGRLHVRVFRVFRWYVFTHTRPGKKETDKNAFRYLAERAVCADGRVVWVRPFWADPVSDGPPPAAVIAQVTELCKAAGERIRTSARRLGFNMPPVGD